MDSTCCGPISTACGLRPSATSRPRRSRRTGRAAPSLPPAVRAPAKDLTMPETILPSVVREISVAAPIDTCFKIFVDGFATWWPPSHHIGDRDVVDFRIEPVVGGRCYDIDTDGGECHWGTVLALEPPRRVAFAWHIQSDWTVDRDPARQSEVEVTFTALNPQRTSVRLEHKKLERHGGGAHDLRTGIDSEGGWTILLNRFGDVAEGRDPRPI